jgi:hypothetical protein
MATPPTAATGDDGRTLAEAALVLDDSEATADVISRHEAARVVVRLAQALDRARELLEATTELHRKVVELHGALAEPLVDLERSLTEAKTQTQKERE